MRCTLKTPRSKHLQETASSTSLNDGWSINDTERWRHRFSKFKKNISLGVNVQNSRKLKKDFFLLIISLMCRYDLWPTLCFNWLYKMLWYNLIWIWKNAFCAFITFSMVSVTQQSWTTLIYRLTYAIKISL